MHDRVRHGCAGAIALALMLLASSARAQLHWDASAQLGVQKRFLAGRPAGASDAGFGPSAQLAAHIALLPLVRVGGYASYDISPLDDPAAARDIICGGARIKGVPPWPQGDLRAYVFVGFGYCGAFARGYDATIAAPVGFTGATAPVRGTVQSAGGGFFDLPFGIGATHKLRKPWALLFELGGRVGFGHTGSVYDAGPRFSSPGRIDENIADSGVDRFALGLSVGILADL